MNSLASVYIQVTIKRSFKGVTGHWTKYGGARQEVYIGRGEQKALDSVWTCQSCATRQPRDMTPYLYEYPQNEYIRICWQCLVDRDMMDLLKRIE